MRKDYDDICDNCTFFKRYSDMDSAGSCKRTYNVSETDFHDWCPAWQDYRTSQKGGT